MLYLGFRLFPSYSAVEATRVRPDERQAREILSVKTNHVDRVEFAISRNLHPRVSRRVGANLSKGIQPEAASAQIFFFSFREAASVSKAALRGKRHSRIFDRERTHVERYTEEGTHG